MQTKSFDIMDKEKKMYWPTIKHRICYYYYYYCVPEILWAELGLKELEELLSPHGVF